MQTSMANQNQSKGLTIAQSRSSTLGTMCGITIEGPYRFIYRDGSMHLADVGSLVTWVRSLVITHPT